MKARKTPKAPPRPPVILAINKVMGDRIAGKSIRAINKAVGDTMADYTMGDNMRAVLVGSGSTESVTPPEPPTGTAIESLPYTISSGGTYYLSDNFTYASGGGGISVNTDEAVVLNGNYKTLTYGSTGVATAITSGYYNPDLEIKNLTLTQGVYTPVDGETCKAISIYGNWQDLSIHNCTITLSKSDFNITVGYTYGILLSDYNTVNPINIIDNTLNVTGGMYVYMILADFQSASAGGLTGYIGNTGHPNTGTMSNCGDTTGAGRTRTSWMSLGGGNMTGLRVTNNTLTIQSSAYSSGGIGAGNSTYVQGVEIDNNTITVAGQNCGAFNLQVGAHDCKIHDNDITVSSANTFNRSTGILLRYAVHDCEIYSNTIAVTGNDISAESTGGAEDLVAPGPPYDNYFHDNVISYDATASKNNYAINITPTSTTTFEDEAISQSTAGTSQEINMLSNSEEEGQNYPDNIAFRNITGVNKVVIAGSSSPYCVECTMCGSGNPTVQKPESGVDFVVTETCV